MLSLYFVIFRYISLYFGVWTIVMIFVVSTITQDTEIIGEDESLQR